MNGSAAATPWNSIWPAAELGSAVTHSLDKRADLAVLAGLLALSAAVAGVSAAVTLDSVGTWYPTLAKPPFNPPNWLFGPVWTALYIGMAVAAWRVWRVAGLMSVALTLYFLQLTFNFAWSLIFFAEHQVALALIDIAALLLAVLATAVAFHRIDRWAGAMLLPYIAWVGFAAALNYGIWRLN